MNASRFSLVRAASPGFAARAAFWISFATLIVARPVVAQITVTYNNGDNNATALSTSGANNPTTLALAAGTATQSGVISGTGALIKTGAGTLNLTADNTYTGNTAVSGGTLALAGAGAKVSATNDLFVGNTSQGALVLSAGASATATGQAIIGFNAGSAGSNAIVSGANSLLRAATFFQVGNAVAARVDVTNGARAEGTTLLLGANPGGNGTLAIDGAGSLFTVPGGSTLGLIGAGHVALSGGGRMITGDAVTMGRNAGSVGTLSITGANSSLQVGNHGAHHLRVGEAGSGTVNLSDGGQMTVHGSLVLGTTTTGSGTVNLHGANTRATVLVFTDGSGTGAINVSGGGEFSVGLPNVFSGDSKLGLNAGAMSTLVVDGAGSWFNAGTLQVGVAGAATLTVGNGGHFQGRLLLATEASGEGTVNLNSGGTIITTAFGRGPGTPVFNLAGGGLRINRPAPGVSSVASDMPLTVSGTTSTIDTNGINLSIDAVVSGAGAFTKIGEGILTLSGVNTHTGTINVNTGQLIVSGSFPFPAGGAIDMAAGTTLTVTGSIAAGRAVNLASGAVLAGTGTIGGSVTIQPGATVSPALTLSGTTNLAAFTTLAPGASAASITWNGSTNGNATAAFALSNSDATSDQATTAGIFARGQGPTYKFDFGGTGHAAPGSPTVYTLVTFGSTTFPSAHAFSYTNLRPGLTGAFSLVSGALRFTVSVDSTPPALAAIRRFTPDAPGTAATSLRFQVVFNEAVTGVDVSDFALTTTGTATGTISSLIGSGPVRYVNVTGVGGTGTIRLDLKAGATGIADSAGNLLPDGAFTAGQVYSRFQTASPVGWGPNSGGVLGDNSTTARFEPVDVVTSGVLAGRTVVALRSSEANPVRFTLALTDDGKLFSWGVNTRGSLGDGTTNSSLVPVAVDMTGALAGKTVVSIATRGACAYAVTSDGKLFAWGSGVFGNGSFLTSSLVPVAVDLRGSPVGNRNIVAITAGSDVTFVLTDDGLTFVWGTALFGQFGNGRSDLSPSPVPIDMSGVLAGKAVVALGVGQRHVVALGSDGKAYTWGDGLRGKLGHGSTTNSYSPVAVDTSGALAGKTVVAVQASTFGSLAVTADGQCYMWGDNSMLGTGSTEDALVPVTVDTSGILAGKTIVAAAVMIGQVHTLTSDGRVVSWGQSLYMGGSGTINSALPTTFVSDGTLAGRTVMALSLSNPDIRNIFAFAGPLPTTVTGVTSPANATYTAGQALDFTATFSEAVSVNTTNGTPGIGLTVGATARTATYVSGSGTTSLVFRYTPQAGDSDENGIATATMLALNGGAIQNVAGQTPRLTFTAPNTSAVLVDTVAPSITSSASASGTYRAGFAFAATASEPVTFGATGLPAGLSIAANGAITGTPTTSGTFNVALTATDAAGNVGHATLEITLTKAALTVTGLTTSDKTYDGSTAATFGTAGAALVGVNAADLGNVTLNTAGAGASFASAAVGSGKTVTITGLALGGAAAGNYVLSSTSATTTAAITAATVVPVVAASNKTYDGTTAATIATRSLMGVLGMDNVTLTGGTAAFVSGGAGSSVTVNVSGLALAGTAAGNYQLSSTSATTTANIARAIVTPVITASNKVYDGINAATIAMRSLTGVVGGDVTLIGGTATFADAAVGTGKTVTIAGLALAGTAAGNYQLASTGATTTANITAATVTPVVTANNKIYDGTTAAAIATRSLNGVIGSDDLTLTGGSATFADTNVAPGQTVTATGLVLAGTAAGNYQLSSASAMTTADITAKALTVTGLSAKDKVYDGTTTATITGTGTLVGVVDGDTVALSGTASGAFADANVGAAKTVTISGLSLTNGSNYTLTAPTATAAITAATLTPVVTASDKIYDGTTAATIASRSLTAVLAADSGNVTLTGGTATFADASAAASKTVTATGLALGGAAAGNYQLSSTTATTTASIGSATATIALGNLSHTYDTLPKSASASTTPAGLGVSLSYDGGSAPRNAGSYSVTASISDPNYTGSTSGTLTIAKANQSISFNAPGGLTVGQSVTLSASASSGLPVTFSLVSGPATLSGNTLTVTGPDAVVVRASQAGDGNHHAALAVERTIGDTTKLAQTITLGALADKFVNDAPFIVSASASSGLPVRLTVSGAATLNGNTLTLTGATGTVTLTASQPGDDTYAAAPDVAQTFTVRAFSPAGIYFGTLAGDAPGAGFAILMRADGTAAFVSYLPQLGFGLLTNALTVDASGKFGATIVPLHPTATASPVLVRGTITGDGAVNGAIEGTGVTFTGTLSSSSGAASAFAGMYQLLQVGTAGTTTTTVIAGANGQAYVYIAAGAAATGAATSFGSGGAIVVTLPDQSIVALTLSGAGGLATGTLTTAAGTVITLVGRGDSLPASERLVNISTRGRTSGGGDATLISGFVIGGGAQKRVLIRVAGPALAGFGVGDALANPRLELFSGATSISANDDWLAGDASAMTAAGAFPFTAASRDAALVATLAPGSYTVHAQGGDGAVLTEIYELTDTGETAGVRRLLNISTRGSLTAGGEPLTAGVVIGGSIPKRVLIRAVGPGLLPHGVATALANPRLRLFRDQTVIKENDDWFRDADAAAIGAAATRAGAFAFGPQSLDAAILIVLEPGAYTAQVESATGAGGVALVEIYEAP